MIDLVCPWAVRIYKISTHEAAVLNTKGTHARHTDKAGS